MRNKGFSPSCAVCFRWQPSKRQKSNANKQKKVFFCFVIPPAGLVVELAKFELICRSRGSTREKAKKDRPFCSGERKFIPGSFRTIENTTKYVAAFLDFPHLTHLGARCSMLTQEHSKFKFKGCFFRVSRNSSSGGQKRQQFNPFPLPLDSKTPPAFNIHRILAKKEEIPEPTHLTSFTVVHPLCPEPTVSQKDFPKMEERNCSLAI